MSKKIDRKTFLKRIGGGVLAAGLVPLAAKLLPKAQNRDELWQIDPNKCTACGKCMINCVQKQSAVKCVHAFKVCGYCELCGGFFRPNAETLTSDAENQLCPSGALVRSFVEDPYYEYVINEKLCVACGKCVKGCGSFGNGSLYLQIKQNICLHCNKCKIAQNCPAQAISRVSAREPYKIKGQS
jgi:electron transport complex protein RnfB